jgi:hypothetical protein
VRNDAVVQALNRLGNEWQQLNWLTLHRKPVPLPSSVAFLRMWQAISDELSKAHSDENHDDHHEEPI